VVRWREERARSVADGSPKRPQGSVAGSELTDLAYYQLTRVLVRGRSPARTDLLSNLTGTGQSPPSRGKPTERNIVIGVSTKDPLAEYLREIGGYPLLTEEQERRLAEACRAGDSNARDQLIRANLRLVVSVARRYSERGMSLLDLIQEGNVGLMKATESFDPSKGFKFSTYATWSIRKSIMEVLRRPPPEPM